jgi:hypothetical protein
MNQVKFLALMLVLSGLVLHAETKLDAGAVVRFVNEAGDFRQMRIAPDFIQELTISNSVSVSNFPITPELSVAFNLKKINNIFTSRTKFYKGHQPVETPVFTTYSGVIKDIANSRIAMTITDGQLYAMFKLNNDMLFLSPSQNNPKEYILTDTRQLTYPRTFGGNDSPETPDEILAVLDKLNKYDKPLSNELLELELAIETDTEFFKATGSDYKKARAYILTLLTQMNMIYLEFINVSINLTWIKIWTDSPADPYDAKGDYAVLRDKAIPYWETNYKDVERDLYHVITAINYGGGGFGYFDALCGKKQFGMSVSSMQGWNNLPTFDFSYDLYILSHEIGHNFNAQHTHSCYWNNAPLDTCVVDNACLPAGQKPLPNPGSIMSYCGGTNNEKGFGYRVRMIFLPGNVEQMRKTAEQATCLTPVDEPFIQLLSPHGSEVFEHSSTINIKWKTNLTDSIDISYSADNEQTWVTIADNIDAKSGLYTWKLPDICSNKMELLLTSQSGSNRSTNLQPFTITMEDPDGLVAHYPFNGNSNDEQLCHFYNARGVNSPSPTSDRLGYASAYAFSGNNYLMTNDFDFTHDSLSVCFWFMLNNLDGKQNLVGTNYQEGWVFETYYWGQLGLSLYVDGKGSPEQLWGGWLSPQIWYYGAFTFDGIQAKFYIDGIKKAEKIWEAPVKLNRFRTPLYMGARKDNDYLNGKLDDIRIYKRALTDSEILGLTDITETISSQGYEITPNPASDYIEISSPPLERGSGGVAPVYIFDILGMEITTPNLTPTLSEGEGVVRIDVSGLAPGVYFVRVGNVVRKFVKI